MTAVQIVPLFVERNTPTEVPAKRFVPLTAREKTSEAVRPESIGLQLAPLFVERKAPLLYVPANRCVPLTARD